MKTETTASRRCPRPQLRVALVIAAFLLAFIILDLITKQFEELPGIVAWYPPAGLTYTLLLVFGLRFAPAVLVALLADSFFIYRMPQPPYALFFWALVMSLIYSAAAAFLRQRIRIDWQLRKLRDVAWFVFTVVFVSALLAILSVASFAITSIMPPGEVLGGILHWWIGETVGVLTIAPFLLIYVMPGLKRFTEGQPPRLPARWSFPHPTLSAVGQAASLALTLYLISGKHVVNEIQPVYYYLIALPLIWIALQSGFKGVTAGILVLNFGIMVVQWFSQFDLARLGEIQLLMIVNCLVGLLMGAVVTDRKQAEEALRAGEARYRSLFDQSIVTVTDKDGRLISASQQFCDMLGYSKDELLGMNFRQITHPDDIQANLEQLDRMVKGEIDGFILDKRYLHKSGETVWININITPIRDAAGTMLQTVGIVQNITGRKLAEEEKEKLQAQFLQSQKMESIGRLAGGVAHDFNNLLGVMIGHAEMGLTKISATTPLYNDLEEILKAARRSADLTRQLLAFARQQTVSPRVLDLNATVASMLKMLRRLIGEDIELAWKPAAGLWRVKIDPSQVDQLLANLLVNARDAIDGVGKVTIETGNTVFSEAYCAQHPGFFPGQYVMLAVSDNGCGMDQGTLSHLFEPFFTTKGIGKGTGLGLATVYGIVKQNNGFINVYSEPGQGTAFKLYLPSADGELEPIEVKRKAETPQRGSETVLLVEDEEALLELGKETLEELGYHVLTANTPGEAIRLAEEHAGAINLLITDVVMPQMNGLELLKRLDAIQPGLKCLFMSGYTANVIAHHGVLDEAVSFIQKPFMLSDLALKVRAVIEKG